MGAWGWGSAGIGQYPWVEGNKFNVPNYAGQKGLYDSQAKKYATRTMPEQEAYIKMLQDQSQGIGGSSVAEEQLRRALEQNLAGSFAQAATIKPNTSMPASQYYLQGAAARSGQELASKGAELRAQEQATARGQLGQAIGQKMNMQELNDRMVSFYTQKGFDVRQSQMMAQMDLQHLLSSNQLEWDKLMFTSSEAELGREVTNKSLITGLFSDRNAKENIVPVASSGSDSGTSGSYLSSIFSDISGKEDIAPIEPKEEIDTAASSSTAPVEPKLEPDSTNYWQQVGSALGHAFAAGRSNKGVMDDILKQYSSSTYRSSLKNQSGGSGVITAALMSDKNSKENQSNAENPLYEFLDNLEPYQYEYKNKEKYGEGKNYGVMAQDMEKSKVGDSIVKETPEGKALVLTKLLSAVVAAEVDLHKRVKELEGR